MNLICNQCGKTTAAGQFCQHCGNALSTAAPVGGLATFRVTARKHLPLWMMIMPTNIFMGYKVYISVDDQEYVLKSKKRQLDIQVVPGVHLVRISSKSKKQLKAMKIIGVAAQFAGAVAGSSSTYVVGSVMEDVGSALSKDGVNVQFDPGEFMELKVKMNFIGQIVEDKKK